MFALFFSPLTSQEIDNGPKLGLLFDSLNDVKVGSKLAFVSPVVVYLQNPPPDRWPVGRKGKRA